MLICSAPPSYLLLVTVLGFVACGGGSSGTQQSSPPPPSPDFSLSAAPMSVSLQQGESSSVSISATGTNGFSAEITVKVSGLPQGVTTSPSTLTLTPAQSQTLTFSASSSATTGNATVTLTGTSGSLSHSASLTVSVIVPITSNTPPFRMRYVRTDAATPYNLWMNSSWIVYNPPTSRFFVTEPDSNRVFVLDASTEAMVGNISVPGAFGIDDTADHTSLYVGTQIGDVYVIDPVSMTVTKRYLAGQIGPNGFNAYSVRVMADGRLALLGGQGGIPSADGYGQFAIWNPVSNSITIYATDYSSNDTSETLVCGPLENIGQFTRTPDRTKVVIASIDSDSTLCQIDEATGTNSYISSGAGFIWQVAISPDGKWIVLPSFGQVFVYDANTLDQVATFVVAGDTSSAAEFFVGPDSQTLYTSSDSDVYAYNLNSGQQVGWFPNIVVPFFLGGSVRGPIYGPQFQAMDGTGLLVGPMEEGVGFLDTTGLRTGAVGTQFLNGYLNPATGPTAGDTLTSWTDYDGETAVESNSAPAADAVQRSRSSPRKLLTSDSTIDVYFGGQNAGSASVSTGSANASQTISVSTPPGAPGRADVYALATDGGVQLLPEGFSYGPTVLEITPNAAAAGGGLGAIMGYGFGATSATTVPSNLQVTVGGTPATITLFTGNAYEITTPPFPLEALTYTIPPGVAGSSADVTVATSSGSVTVRNGITYLPAVQQYPLSGSALAQGAYNPQLDVYYFTDATQIQVFSRTSGTWMTPITFPAADAPQRLWGTALSPDGSQLAVADEAGNAIYVLNPTSPSAVQKFAIPQPITGAGRNPIGVAVSDEGMIYFTAVTPGGTGYSVFYKLDTGSGTVTDYHLGSNEPAGVSTPSPDIYLRTVLKTDNSTVYGNDDGEVFAIDTATDNVSYAKDNPGCCYGDYDLALSSNQAAFAATGYFYDVDLNAESYVGLNLREMMNISDLYGEKLSPDGTMLFQPTTDGIDILDARLGTLLQRIALPMALSPNYDSLVSDGTDNVLVAITGANGDGIAVIDLTSVPEPSPLQYESKFGSKACPTGPKTAPSVKPREAPVPNGETSQHNPKRHTVPHVIAHNLLVKRITPIRGTTAGQGKTTAPSH